MPYSICLTNFALQEELFDYLLYFLRLILLWQDENILKITLEEAPTRVDHDIPNSSVSLVEIVPSWAKPIIEILNMGFINPNSLTIEAIVELENCKTYSLISRCLYK